MKVKINYFLLVGLLIILCSCRHRHHSRSTDYTYSAPTQLGDGLQTASLGAVGMDTAKIVAMTKLILADTFPNIHSLLIFKDNKLVYENYFAGEDYVTGKGEVGYVDHTREDLHDVRSVTKSFNGACIGIAVQQGRIKSIDEPIYPYFPTYAKYFDSVKRKITIRHLLTMTSGLEWDEKTTYVDPKNSEVQMDGSKDPIGFILSRPMAAEPGTTWNYNGGGPQLLEEILYKATGQRLGKFAAQYLFAPLGINKYEWFDIKPGMTAGAWGLRLRPRDMAKFGLLYMNEGRWNGKQIIDKNWVQQSNSPLVPRPGGKHTEGYSFLLWTTELTKEFNPVAVEAIGNGGQRILMAKSKGNIMTVMTAGNYDRNDILAKYWNALPNAVFAAVKK